MDEDPNLHLAKKKIIITKSQDDILPIINDLWNYNDAEATEKVFRELLPKAKDWDAAYYAELLTQLARTQSLQRNFEEAHTILSEVEAMLEANMVIATIRYHLERGRTYNSNNEKLKATAEFKQAYTKAKAAAADFYTVDAAHMLGISDEANLKLEWNLIALHTAEKSVDEAARNWSGSLYNNIGWTYHDEGKFEEALENFEKALAFRIEQKDTLRTFIAQWAIARTLRSLKRTEEAIAIQTKLKNEMESGRADIDGYVYEELAECYLQLDDLESAKPYFLKAYETLSADIWLKANQSERLQRMKELSQ